MGKFILGILILGGAALLVFSGGNKNISKEVEGPNPPSFSSENNQTNQEEFNEKTTLAKIMEKGGNYQCEFSHEIEHSKTIGTVFISGKKIRGDFSSVVLVPEFGIETNMDTHMISDGESVYTWSSLNNEGYKAPVSEGVAFDNNHNIPTGEELNYECHGWEEDESKFFLPVNITFKSV